MVNCSYCNKELDRLVFCGASCKTMYHRNHGAKKEVKHIMAQVLKEEPEFKVSVKNNLLCKHGSMKGLCKHAECNR